MNRFFIGVRGINKYIIDGHCDTVLNMRDSKYNFKELNPSFHIDLPRLKKSGIGIQVFALYVEEKFKPYFAVERTIQLIDNFYKIINCTKEMKVILNYDDTKEISKSNKIGAILAIEGADGVFDLSALRIFYRLGVRLITLTWNNRNHIADGISESETGGGLTKYGKSLVKEMNRMGMIVDISHIAAAGFWDTVKICENNIVASHSNSKNITDVDRNLTDKQIKALAEKNGIIAINFCPYFLNNSGEAEIKDIIRHINYIKKLVGIDYVGLGSDFDGIKNTPVGLKDVTDLVKLRQELQKNGFSSTEIDKIFQKNWLRIFKEVLGGP